MTHRGEIYSNFDHVLNKDVANSMQIDDTAYHPALAFHGTVTRIDTGWREEVWRYGKHIATYEDIDIIALIQATNEKHGKY